jgi:7,8-dihydropterin-6-yl-methyl-4-(beta-D-ribofuranosyl)aminobenzene 5'-phosphate synthase
MSMIQDLTITTLAENSVVAPYLGQWGLSFLLKLVDAEGNPRKVVFDTGVHKESLLYNVGKLKADLSDVDCVVISHGHRDHTAATVEVVKAAGNLKVYAHPHTFLPRLYEDKTGKRRKHGVPKEEGLEEIEKAGGDVYLTNEPTEIVPGVWTTGQIPRVTPFERPSSLSKGERAIIVVNEDEADDQVLDDQALWMDVEGCGSLVVTGCAHAGLVNTVLQVQKLGRSARLHGLVGGTHLVGRSEGYLRETIQRLKQSDLSLISPCHCTGFKATAILWRSFSREFVLNFSGRVIEVEKEPEQRVF